MSKVPYGVVREKDNPYERFYLPEVTSNLPAKRGRLDSLFRTPYYYKRNGIEVKEVVIPLELLL